MPRRVLTALTAAAAAGAAALLAPGVATADTPPTTCQGVIRADGLAFTPPAVAPGQSSAATLSAVNCTGQTQTVSETWLGTWVSSSTGGLPSGCPVIDPLPRSVTFTPYQRVATTTTYLVFPGCTADALRLTVRIAQGGTVLEERTADLAIIQPTAG
ncbi:hypothetical protein [Actinacidiphila acididurans]|uniref:Secreted protein n=1 Tax=Actinacidiphila acididurans TaxID=2784346 RepID=A0ABS2TW83_9ACTN|nr:hypothetical protein [Actinacidiphila acididurans]MBM9507600.1 hypothetical protein [Actinacidiphila acididurans]